jgi:hypothetical protein
MRMSAEKAQIFHGIAIAKGLDQVFRQAENWSHSAALENKFFPTD